ncbi:hypothetical protein BH20ACT24_BH20ACT24_03990 [soil metagenome]
MLHVDEAQHSPEAIGDARDGTGEDAEHARCLANAEAIAEAEAEATGDERADNEAEGGAPQGDP